MIDDAERRRRARIIRESGRTMQSHFESGENWTSLAPPEREPGRVILEILRPSLPSSDLRALRWKSLVSVVVDAARMFPSVLSAAEVMFASPLIKILATNCLFFAATSSSSGVIFDDLLRRQIWISRSQKLIINLLFGAPRIAGSWPRKGNVRWFSIPNCRSGITMGEASGPADISVYKTVKKKSCNYLQILQCSLPCAQSSPWSSHHECDICGAQFPPIETSPCQLACTQQSFYPYHR